MKGTYVFEQGMGHRQTMILDDLKLYIPQGSQYELAVFDDEKEAAQGFNRVMMARFNPKGGWRILEKRMGEAVPPPPERMVGYEPPASTTPQPVDITKTPVHVAGDRLMINVERVEPAELVAALTGHRAACKHLCLYARRKASPGLAALMQNAWPGLETLIIDAHDQPMTRQAACRVGDLSAVLPAVPDLRRLYVGGQLGLTKPVKHTSLVHVSLLANPLPTRSLEVLGKSDLPALTRLDLGVSTESPPDDGWLDALVSLLQRLSPLDVLTLEGPFDGADVLAGLAPAAAHLPRELRLLGSVRDDDALVRAATALAGGPLASLVVPAGELAEGSLTALRRALPAVAEGESGFVPSAWDVEAFLRSAP